jgi:hypothetical protein
MTFPDGGTCTGVTSDNQRTIAIAGRYESSDGTLKFTRMQNPGWQGTLTLTCTVGGKTISQTVQVPTNASPDLAADSDIRIELKDGARSIIPLRLSKGGLANELTIDLTYEDEKPIAEALPQAASPALADLLPSARDLLPGTLKAMTQ